MALILEARGVTPIFGENCFFAPNATIVGQVTMGNYCSVWFNGVVRGDVSPIIMGDYVNVQDGAVIHATYQRNQTTIGNKVSIAHNAIVHGCKIHDSVLVGMGAIVMDDCEIESGAIIGAGAVMKKGTLVKQGEVWAGNPAKFIKLSGDLANTEIERIANAYPFYASWFKK